MPSYNRKTIAIVTAVAAITGIAAFGLARSTATPAPAMNMLGQTLPNNAADPGYVNNSYPPAGMNDSRSDGYYSSIRRPIYVHNAMDSQQQAPPVRETSVEPRTDSEGTVNRTYVSRPYTREEMNHGRSTKKSVAIVAGTAAAGAGIGAIAGGGRGAGIGALSGAGAGFLYDRLTHNH